MAILVLGGDIGGTKTVLGLFRVGGEGGLAVVREQTFSSRDASGLEDLVRAFLVAGDEVAAAALGVAGPVFDGAVVTTNLPWRVEAGALARVIGCPRMRLMNDLEATAYGSLFLPAADLETLNEGVPRPGHRGVIAAGTGLGQALLLWDGKRYWPSATEGGHADFAPRSEREIALWRFLARRWPHVSCERLLSGPGLYNVFSYLREVEARPVDARVLARLESEDGGSVVGQAAVDGSCSTCLEAVDWFLQIYGAQAGNLALTLHALGGMYVGGGIITRLLPLLRPDNFMKAFGDKGRYGAFVKEIPVRIIRNPKTSLLGAARTAWESLGQ